jgi:hypothetical protein
MTNSFAQENQEEFEYNVYTIEEIEHAFAVMEEYVIYDENKNITFDIINTINNPDVTQFDIDVALDFAVHNNDIMDAVIGFTGQVNETQTSENEQLKQALEELENGKFRALFGSETGSVGSVSDITFTTYDFAHTPIISAFGIYEYAKIHQTQHSSSSSTLACGGNYQNPHPVDSTPTTTTSGFSSLGDAQQELYQNGYHMVPSYASWGGESAQDIDFAKVVTSGAPGNCNNGPFRDEAVINPYTHSSYTVTEDEPNPEILSYWWPKLWWGVYVEWWHDRF